MISAYLSFCMTVFLPVAQNAQPQQPAANNGNQGQNPPAQATSPAQNIASQLGPPATGISDLIRSSAASQIQNCQAAQQYEEARRLYLANRLQAAQAYLELRRANQIARRSESGSPFSYEQNIRMAQQQAPPRLTESQLDPLTGAINWPAPLRHPRYQNQRERLNALFAARTVGAPDREAVQATTDELLMLLKDELENLPANDYLAARRFVEALRNEE